MDTSSFPSLKEVFSFAWKRLTGDFWYFVGLFAIVLATSILISGLSEALQRSGAHLAGVILSILGYAIQLLFGLGLISVSLKMYDGEKPSYKELYLHGTLFWQYLGVTVIYSLAMLVGFILLVIPGIWVTCTYFFAPYVLFEKKIGIKEAFKESARLTKGNKWKIFGLFIINILLSLLGFVVFGVGLLVTMPLTLMAYVYVYKQLSTKDDPVVITPVEEAPAH